jgi:hypothetical protein
MSNELRKVNAQQLTVPEFVKTATGNEGFEEMTPDAVSPPQLLICQSQTAQRNESKPNYIKGLNEGDLFNSTSEEIYGPTVELTPILFNQSRTYFSEERKILCQSPNARDGGSLAARCQDCPHSKFPQNGKPDCTLYYNYLVVLWPVREVLTFPLKSSAIKVGKVWNSIMKRPKRPMFAGVYEINIVSQSAKKGTYFGPVIKFKRSVTEDEYHYAFSIYNTMYGQPIVAEEVEPPEPPPTVTEEVEPPEPPPIETDYD